MRTTLLSRWACGALLALAQSTTSALTSQTTPNFSGVWLLDMTRKDAREAFAEVRVVDQAAEEVRLTMIDYGAMWVEGAFRGVVRFTPWTYRFGSWGPRRGGPSSTQPITRARWSENDLVLVKSPGESFGHTWLWRTS